MRPLEILLTKESAWGSDTLKTLDPNLVWTPLVPLKKKSFFLQGSHCEHQVLEFIKREYVFPFFFFCLMEKMMLNH